MRSLYTGLFRLFLFFFPIRSDELRKFIPFCLLIFITTFVHHLLRVVKDPLVLSEPGSGAEVLSFLKLYF
ncbi:MAG: Npt1/Npt2 family nucleotide transporter, partial [Pseudomonadota bacterium]|nr:Npt1/Npt2 family nucleotide transporter [Pseudomonadota bacterium]